MHFRNENTHSAMLTSPCLVWNHTITAKTKKTEEPGVVPTSRLQNLTKVSGKDQPTALQISCMGLNVVNPLKGGDRQYSQHCFKCQYFFQNLFKGFKGKSTESFQDHGTQSQSAMEEMSNQHVSPQWLTTEKGMVSIYACHIHLQGRGGQPCRKPFLQELQHWSNWPVDWVQLTAAAPRSEKVPLPRSAVSSCRELCTGEWSQQSQLRDRAVVVS